MAMKKGAKGPMAKPTGYTARKGGKARPMSGTDKPTGYTARKTSAKGGKKRMQAKGY